MKIVTGGATYINDPKNTRAELHIDLEIEAVNDVVTIGDEALAVIAKLLALVGLKVTVKECKILLVVHLLEPSIPIFQVEEEKYTINVYLGEKADFIPKNYGNSPSSTTISRELTEWQLAMSQGDSIALILSNRFYPKVAEGDRVRKFINLRFEFMNFPPGIFEEAKTGVEVLADQMKEIIRK